MVEFRATDGRHRVEYEDGDVSWDKLEGKVSRSYRWVNDDGSYRVSRRQPAGYFL